MGKPAAGIAAGPLPTFMLVFFKTGPGLYTADRSVALCARFFPACKLSLSACPPAPEGAAPGLPIMQHGVELTRRFHSSPSFVAMHELLLAARTDGQHANTMRRYPFWAKAPKTILLIHDLVQFTCRGIAMSHMDDLDPQRLANLQHMLARVAYAAYQSKEAEETKASAATAEL